MMRNICHEAMTHTSAVRKVNASTELCLSNGRSSFGPKMRGKNSGSILPSTRLASVTARVPPGGGGVRR